MTKCNKCDRLNDTLNWFLEKDNWVCLWCYCNTTDRQRTTLTNLNNKESNNDIIKGTSKEIKKIN